MSNTLRLSLPLLEAAQAQKHVTVNEALVRLDALASGIAEAGPADAAPVSPVEGALYLVGGAPAGDWTGEAHALALRSGGAWVFAAPVAGMAFAALDTGVLWRFDGAGWVAGHAAGSAGGAATVQEVLEVDHTLAAGASSTVSAAIPAGAMVLGVTGRVIAAIGGASGWRLGVSGSDNRYGAGLGTAQGSFASGLTGSPVAYYSDTDLVLTAEGGSFTGGTVRLAVHLMRLVPPA